MQRKISSVVTSHTNAFLKVSVFVSMERSKILSTTLAFSNENADFLMRFRLSSTLKRSKTPIETTVDGAYFRHRFQKPPYVSPIHTRNDAFSKASTFETVFINVFGR